MQLTKGAIGNLINRYKAVLKKCHLMNTFGSLAVAGMLVMGGAGVAVAADDLPLEGEHTYDSEKNPNVNHLMGGWLVKDAATAGDAKGDITLTVNGGTISEIIGGSYAKNVNGNNVTVTHGDITTTISDDTTSAEFVVGGSKVAGGAGANLETGKTTLTITGGTFGTQKTDDYELVMGGNYAKTAGSNPLTATTEGSSVTVKGGTFHASVVGGSVAHNYSINGSIAVTDNGNTSVNITGGTFAPSNSASDVVGGINLSAAVIGGGLAYGANTSTVLGSDTQDVTSSVTISGDAEVKGKVVAGGAAVNGGSSTVTHDTSLTMTDGKVDGDLIGGGFVDSSVDSSAGTANNKANVDGSTHITVSGGSLVDAEIIGGGSVRNANGAANVTGDTHVTVTKYANDQVDQKWVQYVLGGGKAMTNGTQTATANVDGSTNVTIGEQGATGEALDIKFGTVAGGGLARAQKGEGFATATVTNANVTVHSGILSGVAGGGIAENYGTGTADATVTNANLTINGGTINGVKYKGVDNSAVAVLGGGIAKGAGATANATTTTNTVINGGTINGHVVAGGLADGGTATVGTANLTIKGGEINGSVYAGGAALGGDEATVDNFDVRIMGGTITKDVVAGNYTGDTGASTFTLLGASPYSGGSSKGSITIGGDAAIGGKVDASAEGVATNVIIDGADAKVTGGYEGNKYSTLTFNNYNDKFNNTATGFGYLNVAEGSNVQMDNLSTGAKGTPDTSNPNADKGFFGDGSNVTVNGKGTVTATNVNVANNTLTVTDGSTLDAKTLTTTGSGKAKTDGLGSTLIIGNTGEKALDSIYDGSLSSTAGSEIQFTGLGDSVDATDIKDKLDSSSNGIVNVGETKVKDLSDLVKDGQVDYTAWTSKTGGITNNELKKATLTGVNSPVNKIGSFGSAELATGTDKLTVDTNGNLTLTGLDTSNNFVSTSEGKKAGATIGQKATLTLGDNAYAGNKGIGDITINQDATLNVLGQSAAAATVNSGAITPAAAGTKVNAKNVTLNVAGNIGADAQAIGTITADAANVIANGDVYANTVTLTNGLLQAMATTGDTPAGGDITLGTLSGQGAVVADKTLTVTDAYNGADTDALGLQADTLTTGAFDSTEGTVAIEAAQWNASGLTTLKGDTVVLTEAGNFTGAFSMDGGAFVAQSEDADAPATLTFSDGATFTNGASVLADSISMGADKTLSVGSAADTIGGTTLSARHINLNGGMLLVDPAWGLTSSNVAVESLSATTAADDITVNGSVGVGQNSYLALGTKDTTWLPGVVAGYTNGEGLSKDGITAALGVFEGIQIAGGEGLVVNGSLTDTGLSSAITSNTATFADNSLLVINGQNIYGDTAAISFENNASTLKVGQDAKLLVTDAVDGQNYTIVDNVTTVKDGTSTDIATGGTVWKTEGLSTTTDMISLGDAKFDGTDKVTTSAVRNDAHTVFPNLSDGMANAVNDLYTGHAGAAGQPNWDYADVNSDQMGVRFLSRATDNRFLGADKDAAAATIESAARIAFAGAVPQMTKMASDAGTNAVVNRLGFANPADGAQAMDAEGKIVDRNTTGFALWIAPLWQSQHGWGMEADNLDYGFNGNLGGVSLGADYTFENAIRAGITFNIGGGYAESSGGDLNSTENRMSFWGLGAYAGWNYENFGLMADVSYTSTWNDLKQDMDSRMGMGDLEADVQASAISAGLRAEYKLETSVLDVIPHIGVRYMSLNTWGFDAESNGGTVLEGDGFHQDIWTFPVGVTFTKDFTLDSGWSFKPSIDFSVIPAAGDIKAKQDVAFTGLPGSYEVETQMMDYLTWQGGVGLEMGNDTMSFGVNYTLQAGQHTTGHGVFGSFRYEF